MRTENHFHLHEMNLFIFWENTNHFLLPFTGGNTGKYGIPKADALNPGSCSQSQNLVHYTDLESRPLSDLVQKMCDLGIPIKMCHLGIPIVTHKVTQWTIQIMMTTFWENPMLFYLFLWKLWQVLTKFMSIQTTMAYTHLCLSSPVLWSFSIPVLLDETLWESVSLRIIGSSDHRWVPNATSCIGLGRCIADSWLLQAATKYHRLVTYQGQKFTS